MAREFLMYSESNERTGEHEMVRQFSSNLSALKWFPGNCFFIFFFCVMIMMVWCPLKNALLMKFD